MNRGHTHLSHPPRVLPCGHRVGRQRTGGPSASVCQAQRRLAAAVIVGSAARPPTAKTSTAGQAAARRGLSHGTLDATGGIRPGADRQSRRCPRSGVHNRLGSSRRRDAWLPPPLLTPRPIPSLPSPRPGKKWQRGGPSQRLEALAATVVPVRMGQYRRHPRGGVDHRTCDGRCAAAAG